MWQEYTVILFIHWKTVDFFTLLLVKVTVCAVYKINLDDKSRGIKML